LAAALADLCSLGGVVTYLKAVLRVLLALAMVGAGIMHFVDPAPFVRIVPPYLPWPLGLVYVSGVFEILGGVGLLPARTRSAAGWGLVALYIAVFPANLHMALHDIPFGDEPVPPAMLWGRLPLQLVFIAWAWWVSRPDQES
jgi:uncharacterized membrane protein